MSEVYYLVAAIAYGIFILQFILSWFGGDTDLDVNLDGDVDMNVNDIVSFKGLIHFLMGAFGWLSIKEWSSGTIMWWDYLIALACGIIFVIVLYYLYKLIMKLEHKPSDQLRGKDLIGRGGTVYLRDGKDGESYRYVILMYDGHGSAELPAKSSIHYVTGERVVVKDFVDNIYIV